jgi:hypothetical protein
LDHYVSDVISGLILLWVYNLMAFFGGSGKAMKWSRIDRTKSLEAGHCHGTTYFVLGPSCVSLLPVAHEMRNFGLLCPSARIFCLAMGQNQLIMHWYL